MTFYRQNYFASGFSSETPVKFQISLQYELWPNRTSHAVRFAYTQKSLWDLWAFNESSPFLETNYEPELFYLHRGRLTRDDTARGCGLGSGQLGLDHESNGRGGARSRAWNRVYGAARFMCTGSAQAFASATARLWWPFGTADNPDITDFLGFGEMELAARTPDPFAWYGTFELWVTLRKGASAPLERGSVLGELAWNPGYGGVFGRLWRFTPYLYAQLFAGYGETLISYDRSDLSARAGLGLRDYARPAP